MPYHTRVKFGPTTLPTQITLGRLVVSPVFVLCCSDGPLVLAALMNGAQLLVPPG